MDEDRKKSDIRSGGGAWGTVVPLRGRMGGSPRPPFADGTVVIRPGCAPAWSREGVHFARWRWQAAAHLDAGVTAGCRSTGFGHSPGMTAKELQSLPAGTRITYVEVLGATEDRHPAKVVDHAAGWTGVLIYFTNKDQQKIRWSTATNQPIGTKGYLGKVCLDR
jgi:hypothetical protein